ncbi:TetR/AcrR family transcriptional regulator [Rhizobium johnstonii]|uniref:TetR/AcrR family transcriptional regulator n=1 Tax=Rhizobium TaxID=379 RepID=UPI0010308B1B|nr:TetR/AcrR family transcriptional regulator [Rhizobium leguminosarum]TBH46051.1 TetR/AcrR family transcriptional regulator [Rhizobium leguminosarum]
MAASDAILDAAEKVFGVHGFDGGNMREIAKVCGVSQSLLHYHYNNKDRLYEAVFQRRAEAIRLARFEKLSSLLNQQGEVLLEEVLAVLFQSLEKLLNERRGNLKYYVQMLAEVTIRGDERSIDIVRRYYDPTALSFIAAFKRAVPSLTDDAAIWAYLFAIGARLQVHSPSNRAQRLAQGTKISSAAGYELLTQFVAAGIRGLAMQQVKAELEAM